MGSICLGSSSMDHTESYHCCFDILYTQTAIYAKHPSLAHKKGFASQTKSMSRFTQFSQTVQYHGVPAEEFGVVIQETTTRRFERFPYGTSLLDGCEKHIEF